MEADVATAQPSTKSSYWDEWGQLVPIFRALESTVPMGLSCDMQQPAHGIQGRCPQKCRPSLAQCSWTVQTRRYHHPRHREGKYHIIKCKNK